MAEWTLTDTAMVLDRTAYKILAQNMGKSLPMFSGDCVKCPCRERNGEYRVTHR